MMEELSKKYLGVPYKLHGRDMKGLDCYGLLMLAFKDINIVVMDTEVEYEEDWSWKSKNYFVENYHKDWEQIEKPKLYDLVAFMNADGVANHAGIMLDDTRFIHTCLVGTVINKITEPGFQKRLVGFYRHKSLCS